MSPIKDIKTYNDHMKRAIYDKLFFVDKIDPTYIVDFGCADGQMMREIQNFFPNTQVVGVDNNRDMRDLNKDHVVFASLDEVPQVEGSALILSSVLHELYSYCNETEIRDFWTQALRFDYLVIRDMAVPNDCFHAVVPAMFADELRTRFPGQTQDFEQIWGSLNERQNFLHFLLKYRYTANWDREVTENYLANTSEQLVHLAHQHGRHSIYEDRFVLPYLQDVWNTELDMKVSTPTHIKLITKKS
jgi:hypothetical protein